MNKRNAEGKHGHRKTGTIIAIIIIVAVVAMVFAMKGNDKSKSDFKADAPIDIAFNKEGELWFMSPDAKDTLAVIGVEVADDDAKRIRGLMYRKSMPADGGMLFVHDYEEEQSFWMKNTYFPLDMIFINKAKMIVNVCANAKPLDESSYSSIGPALYVIEVNGGFCNIHNIGKGDLIDFKISK